MNLYRKNTFIKLGEKTMREYRRNGLKGVIVKTYYFLRNLLLRRHSSFFLHSLDLWKKNEEDGGYITMNDDEKKIDNTLSPKKIVYIIPSTRISGGLHIILIHTNMLLVRGYDVSMINLEKETSVGWYENKVPIISAFNIDGPFLNDVDILIATHWTTAFYMDLMPAKRKMYFVQSDERRFNPFGQKEISLIETTYHFDCEYMTEAIWIQRWLKQEFNKDAYYVPNGIDLDVFNPNHPLKKGGTKPRILIEGATDVWYKGMHNAYTAVKDLNCEIWIVSNHGRPKRGWRYESFFCNVPIRKMASIYASCTILLKMSEVEGFFGPPLEAMACGCAVVTTKCTGHDEYIKNDYNALIVERNNVKAASKAIKLLIKDGKLREGLVKNGYETAKKWSWKRSIYFLEKAIKKGPIEIFYTDTFPNKYNYQEEIKLFSIYTP